MLLITLRTFKIHGICIQMNSLIILEGGLLLRFHWIGINNNLFDNITMI
jgi:hypothetical protein